MARSNRGLTDQSDRENMVVMLEDYPEEDIDATLGLEESFDSETVGEAMEAATPVEGGGEFLEEITVLVEDWDPKTSEGKKYHQQLKSVHKKEAERQGYNAREDESLGMDTGPEDTKTQSEAARRDESYGDYGTRTA